MTEEELDAWDFYMSPPPLEPVAVVVSRYRSEDDALKASREVLSRKMAACYHTRAIQSGYIWEGVLTEDHEWEADFVTTVSLGRDLLDFIASRHPYKVPHVSLSVVNVTEPYSRWVESCVI